MGHPAIKPAIHVVAHAVAALGEDRLPLRQPFALEVAQE